MSQQNETEFLKNYNISDYARPSIASDIVTLSLLRKEKTSESKSIDIDGVQLLLIKRGTHPYKDKWALPGGFCKPNETVYETAKRELYEETNVSKAYLHQKGIYSEQGRDPRGWIISNTWLGLINTHDCKLRADTDTWDAKWFTIKSLTTKKLPSDNRFEKYEHSILLENEEINMSIPINAIETIDTDDNYVSVFDCKSDILAFDHAKIITKTLVDFRDDTKSDIRPLFDLLPSMFTLGQLQTVYELVIGEKSQNFRRNIKDYVIRTDFTEDGNNYRPAKYYIRNMGKFKYR